MKTCLILLLVLLWLPFSARAQEIITDPFCFPDAPSDIQLSWSDKPRGALISWTATEIQATGYRIYRREVVGDFEGFYRLTVFETGPEETSYLDRRANPKRSYAYIVVALSECGESGFYGPFILTAVERP
jgi:hypothetical protein